MNDGIGGSHGDTGFVGAEVEPRGTRLDTVASADSLAAIVLGHDSQPQSRAALEVAIDLADRLSAHLHIVHALDLADEPIDPDSSDWEEQTRRMLAKERTEVADALSSHTTGWTYHAGHGEAAHLLARVADEHDALMIVIGSRGEGIRASAGRLLSAPVSHRLIQHARQPVLVVRLGIGRPVS